MATNLSTQFVIPFGDTEVVPLSHRIFLGGRKSLRGFKRGQVGPKTDEGVIVGGDRALFLNTELRYDLLRDVTAFVFLDMGQSIMKFRGDFVGDDLSLSDLRFSPGLGLAYKTPIGPLSIEYAFVLDRQEGEPFGRFALSMGGAF